MAVRDHCVCVCVSSEHDCDGKTNPNKTSKNINENLWRYTHENINKFYSRYLVLSPSATTLKNELYCPRHARVARPPTHPDVIFGNETRFLFRRTHTTHTLAPVTSICSSLRSFLLGSATADCRQLHTAPLLQIIQRSIATRSNGIEQGTVVLDRTSTDMRERLGVRVYSYPCINVYDYCQSLTKM